MSVSVDLFGTSVDFLAASADLLVLSSRSSAATLPNFTATFASVLNDLLFAVDSPTSYIKCRNGSTPHSLDNRKSIDYDK